MSLNGPAIRLLTKELNDSLLGARVDKIYQENKDVSIHLRAGRENKILYFSFSSDTPAVYLTDKKQDYPQEPPSFCMLLRKYLVGARVLKIEQVRMDRIISITFSTSADIYSTDQIKMQFESMGKYSNLIVVDANNNEIIDSLIRVYPDMSSVRLVLPKEEYKLPEANGLYPLSASQDDIKNKLEESKLQNLKTSIFKSFEGLNPDISTYILHTANINEDINYANLDQSGREHLIITIYNVFQDILNYNLTAIVYKKNDIPFKLSAFDLSPSFTNGIEFDTMNDAVRYFYETKSTYKIISSRTHDLRKKINHKISSLEKTLSIHKKDYLKSKDREDIKIKADLLAANIYKISRGDKFIEVNNFYSEDNELIKIPIDETLSPKQNVDKLYNRYNKMKNRELNLKKRMPQIENEIYYLKSAIINLDQAETSDEINQIKEELKQSGFLKQGTSKKKIRNPKISFREYKSPSGFKVLAGRNNIQNDQLTFKVSHKEDLWFHLRNEPGTHVILECHNKDYSEYDIIYAANVAGVLSGKTVKCDIDYTEVKNVKKIKNQNPGLVNYYNYKTITIDPDENNM